MRVLILAITLLVLGSPILETAAASPAKVSALAGQGCELVELYPGYPGYVGYVTGVDGIGDHACLDDLEDQDRSFDRDDEDDANREAAQALGINGGPVLWTWENWMAIEDERGMIPTCYTCLVDGSSNRRQPSEHNIERDDPRLLAGGFLGNEIYSGLSQRTAQSEDLSAENVFYRSVAYASEGKSYLNAAELVARYPSIYEAWYTVGGSRINWEAVWCNTVRQNGYAPTPLSAHPSDQYWLVLTVFYLYVDSNLNSFAQEALSYQDIEAIADQWLSEQGFGSANQSLASYLNISGLPFMPVC